MFHWSLCCNVELKFFHGNKKTQVNPQEHIINILVSSKSTKQPNNQNVNLRQSLKSEKMTEKLESLTRASSLSRMLVSLHIWLHVLKYCWHLTFKSAYFNIWYSYSTYSTIFLLTCVSISVIASHLTSACQFSHCYCASHLRMFELVTCARVNPLTGNLKWKGGGGCLKTNGYENIHTVFAALQWAICVSPWWWWLLFCLRVHAHCVCL